MKYTSEKYPLVKATEGAAGFDLSANIDEPILIYPGEIKKIPTGIRIQPDNFWLLFGRSSLGANNGVTLANAVGVIDIDYRGEIIVALQNHGDTRTDQASRAPFYVNPGERIAQLVSPFNEEVEQVNALDETERGEGGFGSTGTGALEVGDINA